MFSISASVVVSIPVVFVMFSNPCSETTQASVPDASSARSALLVMTILSLGIALSTMFLISASCSIVALFALAHSAAAWLDSVLLTQLVRTWSRESLLSSGLLCGDAT